MPMPAYRLTATGAFRRLRELAAQPYDLAREGALTPGRIESMRAAVCGFDLLFATQRVTEEVLRTLHDLAAETEVQQQFARIMAGEAMNRIEGHESENRRVLHTASRNVFADLPDPLDMASRSDAVEAARGELGKLRGFLERIERGEFANAAGEPFTDLVNVGIGGSDLGPRALYLALEPWRAGGRRVHFVSNVDPDDMARVLGSLDLSRTLVNVVSKSGTTLETVTNETLAREAFRRAGLDPARHFTCVTGAGSPMDDPARYAASFHMFDYIGGRYSATSMVGGVCLGFGLGYGAFESLLRGAREMDLHALQAPPGENLPLLAALLGVWNRNLLGHETLAVIPYSQALIRFAAHLQQLDMESNGKRITRQGEAMDYATGPIVWGEPGTNGQHAFFQLIHQSETVVPLDFIGFRQSQSGTDLDVQGTSSQQKLLANMLAQAVALATGQRSDNPNKVFPGNRPSLVLLADRLDPHRLGALLAFYEHKVTYQGLLWNINSFDQEGVQLGKVLANRYIEHFHRLNEGQAPDTGADATGWAMLKAARLA